MSETGLQVTPKEIVALRNLGPGVLSIALWELLKKLGDGQSMSDAASCLRNSGVDPKVVVAALGLAALIGVGRPIIQSCLDQNGSGEI